MAITVPVASRPKCPTMKPSRILAMVPLQWKQLRVGLRAKTFRRRYSATSATSGSSPPANAPMRSVYSGNPRV